MRVAALSLLLMLLGTPQEENPFKRFLDQKEWYGRVVCKMRGKGETGDKGGGWTWSLKRRAVIDFRIHLDPGLVSMAAQLERFKSIPGMTEKDRKEMEKAVARRLWLPDMKKKEQTEELLLAESTDRWDQCAGGEGCPRKNLHCKIRDDWKKSSDGRASRELTAQSTLEIDSMTGTFNLAIRWDDQVPTHTTESRNSHDPEDPPAAKPKDEIRGLEFGSITVNKGALPKEGINLQGRRPVKGPTDFKARGSVHWALSPKPLPPIELKFELANYKDWRPKGSMDENEPGNEIGVRAWLEAKGGGPVEDKARYIQFELEDVTREKGICLNYPENPKNPPDPDLKFLSSSNPQLQVTSDDIATLKGEKLLEAKAVISSFDWGAWGRLKVRAVLESGREVVGTLKDDPDEKEEAPVPKSREGSWIADSWRDKTGAQGDDDSDDENDPVGDGRKGDGLTLYEEYRGWHEGGYRRQNEFDGGGDPKRKEIFICDRTGAYMLDALHYFGKMTKLRVIWQLTEKELDSEAVINFNHGAKPRWQVNQHGINIVVIPIMGDILGVPGLAGISGLTGKPGTPGETRWIALTQGPRGTHDDHNWMIPDYSVLDTTRTVVHELCHCCNVYHHGNKKEDLTGVAWRVAKDGLSNSTLMEGLVPIKVLDEETKEDVTGEYIREIELQEAALGEKLVRRTLVGQYRGQCSGEANCVMTYTNTQFFKSKNPSIRYRIRRGEGLPPPFFTLCTTERGTVWNDALHDPESHFGPASTGFGKCAQQIVVSDAYAPTRAKQYPAGEDRR